MVPSIRIRVLNDASVASKGRFVVYWMAANRRLSWNFALQRAVELAAELGRPLVVLETLSVAYPWASDRFHCFVMDGMREHDEQLASSTVLYYPFVESRAGQIEQLVTALSQIACAVVTDDYPFHFLIQSQQAVALSSPVRVESVDANGLMPVRSVDRLFTRAYSFRRHLQRVLPSLFGEMPVADPLSEAVRRPDLPRLEGPGDEIEARWPAATWDELRGQVLGDLPIDHSVSATALSGGHQSALTLWSRFLDARLQRYHEGRNNLDNEAVSGLSAHLHFGHVGAHQLVHELLRRENWSVELLGPKSTGSRQGWWGLSEPAEAFLDQLVTWRELGFNACALDPEHARYDALPQWARATLEAHATDPREHLYLLEEFDEAATHDPLWNAAQRQLLRDGRIHNYLRMLWGKKILEWSRSPRHALEIMLELNNRYALDGRDPNSVSGIFWTLGRYDRAWGPERPIFGKIRYMSSDSARRKLRVSGYLERYGKGPSRALFQ